MPSRRPRAPRSRPTPNPGTSSTRSGHSAKLQGTWTTRKMNKEGYPVEATTMAEIPFESLLDLLPKVKSLVKTAKESLLVNSQSRHSLALDATALRMDNRLGFHFENEIELASVRARLSFEDFQSEKGLPGWDAVQSCTSQMGSAEHRPVTKFENGPVDAFFWETIPPECDRPYPSIEPAEQREPRDPNAVPSEITFPDIQGHNLIIQRSRVTDETQKRYIVHQKYEFVPEMWSLDSQTIRAAAIQSTYHTLLNERKKQEDARIEDEIQSVSTQLNQATSILKCRDALGVLAKMLNRDAILSTEFSDDQWDHALLRPSSVTESSHGALAVESKFA